MTKPTKRSKARKRLFFRKTKRYTKASFLTVWRVLLFALMFVLTLFCVVWIFFLRTFNAQHVNEIIAEQLQKRLDRPVKISSLELKFVNTIELKGVYVLDTQGNPGQTFLAADSVTVDFALLPLLDHQLVIREVSLNSPRFNLVRLQDGTYNIPRAPLNRQENTYTSSTGQKFEISIEDWRIKNGVFYFQDKISGATHAFYGLNARFDNLRLDELSHFTLEMVLRNQWKGNISELEIEANGQVNLARFDWNRFALRNVKAQISLFDDPVDVTLDLDNLTAPSFKLGISAPAFQAEDLSQFGLTKTAFEIPVSVIRAEGQLTEGYTQLAVNHLSAAIGDVKLTGSGRADFAAQPWSLRADFATDWFALAGKEKLWGQLAAYRLAGKGKLAGQLTRSNGKYTLPLFTAQAADVSGNFYGFATENLTGEFQAKNNFADLYARTANGKVTVARSTFDELQLSASWRKGTLYASIASAQLNGEPLKLDVNIQNLKKDDRRIHTRMYFKNFNPVAFINTVQDFVTVILPLTGHGESAPEVTGDLAWLRNFRDRLPNFMPNFSGLVTADTFTSGVLTGNQFNAQFNFTGLTAGAKALSGPVQLRLQNGVIHQMEQWAAEQEALNVTFQPFIMMHRMERAGSFSVGKVLRDVEVEELGVSAAFTNGKMQVHNAYTVGPSISAAVSGWTDWVQELFDLTIYTMFTNTSKSGVLAENLTDESGNPALAFRLSASMLKPKLEMLRAKQAGKTIRAAQAAGVGTDFEDSKKFIQGDYHATK